MLYNLYGWQIYRDKSTYGLKKYFNILLVLKCNFDTFKVLLYFGIEIKIINYFIWTKLIKNYLVVIRALDQSQIRKCLK